MTILARIARRLNCFKFTILITTFLTWLITISLPSAGLATSKPILDEQSGKHITKRLFGTASWYDISSSIKEGSCTDPAKRRCLTASGRPLDDEAYTAASWDYGFGTHLTVCRDDRGDRLACVQAVVTDRGPARRLVRQGRILDLSQAAFQAVCGDLRQGLCEVEIQEAQQ